MQLLSYASSSKGNCHVLKGLNSDLVLDCGVSSRKLTTIIAQNNIAGILVTHIHGDHSQALKNNSVMLQGAKVYTNDEVINNISIDKYNTVEIQTKKIYTINDEWDILAFEVPHDAKNFAYIISNKFEDKKVMYITDVGKIDQFKIKVKVDTYIIEANYDENLYQDIDELDYQHFIKYKRLTSNFGHISVQQCVKFLQNNITEDTNKIFLVHISHDNPNYLAFETYAQEKLPSVKVTAINNLNKFVTNEI